MGYRSAPAVNPGLGYRPDKLLSVTVTTRNVPAYRHPTVLLVVPKAMRKDYAVGFAVSENRLDDPAGSQQLKGYTMMVNGNYNGWRLDDARLEQ